jgi:hypothetical protein
LLCERGVGTEPGENGASWEILYWGGDSLNPWTI